MNTTRKRHLSSLVVALVFMLSQSPKAIAMTADGLADICEAMESAIMDMSVEYEWGVEPPPTTEDMTGPGSFIVRGPSKWKWLTKRPFDERSLTMEQSTFLNEHEDSFDSMTMQSYNGKVAKHLTTGGLLPAGLRQGTISRGTITESARFVPLPNQTPLAFSVLRLSCVNNNDVPLSERLRDRELVRFDGAVKKINGFNAVHADLLIDNPTTKSKQLDIRVYFSVDHGYTPIKYDYISVTDAGPEPSFVVDVNSLEQVSEGLWFPSSGSLGLVKNNLTNTYRATNIVVNQGLVDEDFNIEFPPGTKVRDEVAGLTYVVKPTEDQFNKWLQNEEWLRQTEAKQARMKRSSETTRNAANPSRTTEESANEAGLQEEASPSQLGFQQPRSKIRLYGVIAAAAFVFLLSVFLVRKRILA